MMVASLLLLIGCKGDISSTSALPAADVDPVAHDDGGVWNAPTPAPGDCSGCLEQKVGIGGTGFDTASNDSEFVSTDSDGALVIDMKHSKLSRYLWVADTNLPGVAKIDLTTLQIVARYRTGGSSTSRTTVNALGEAFIGARTSGNGKYGVTKILPDPKTCPDKNNDGVVTTSKGPDDVLAWGQDECVAWHVETEGDIRGLAAQDIPGLNHEEICKDFQGNKEFDPKQITAEDEHYVWVGGLHGKVYKIDAETGAILLKIDAPLQVYGMALSGDGKLWLGAGGGGFGFIDIDKCTDQATCDATTVCTQTCNTTTCPATCDNAVKAAYSGMLNGYGITVDYKKRVWRSGYPTAGTMRYDPYAPADQRLAMSPVPSYGGGIAADANGFVWAAHLSGHLVRIDADSLAGVTIAAPSKGVAVDAQGRVFAVQYEGIVHMVEPGKTLNDNKLTLNAVPLKGIAYAYSDMTGIQTRLASGEPGWYRGVFSPCLLQETPDWQLLKWDVDAPTGTWVMFNVRTADTAEALKTAPWSTVACISPPGGKGQATITALKGRLVEAEVRFIAAGDLNDPATVKSARIKSFSVLYRCLKVD